MIDFEYSVQYLDSTREAAEKWLNKPLSDGGSQNVEKETGNGYLFFKELEQGLTVFACEAFLNDDTRFYTKPTDSKRPVVFSIHYMLSSATGYVEIDNIRIEKSGKQTVPTHSIVSTNRNSYTFFVKKNEQFKSLLISFTEEWFLQQFLPGKRELFRKTLCRKNTRQQTHFIPVTAMDFRVVHETLERTQKKEWDTIFLRSQVMSLINATVNNVTSGKAIEESTTEYMPVMIEVEKKLTSLLNNKMPGLPDLAKEFLLSESTLKRQFRQTYGSSIYEYYLFKKMELAKKMLVPHSSTIKEVSFSLGYEKTSSFIKAFKKEFGVSPGSLRTVYAQVY